MSANVSATQKPKKSTLGEALNEVLSRRRWSSCSHEEEIADDIRGEVRRLLQRFDLLDVSEEEAVEVVPRCRFCASSELQVVHKPWCAEK